MLFLFLSAFYSHYYTWWSIFNILNDEFYAQLMHQTVFSVTEMLSTLVVLWMCDKRNNYTPRPLVIVLWIALFHIIVSSSDQFVSNVLWNAGSPHQTARDIAFMCNDIIHLVVVCLYIRHYMKSHKQKLTDLIDRDEKMLAVLMLCLFTCLCIFL